MTNKELFEIAETVGTKIGARGIFEYCKNKGLNKDEIYIVNRLSDLILFENDMEYKKFFVWKMKGTRVYNIAVEYGLIDKSITGSGFTRKSRA